MRNGIVVPLDGTRFAEAALPLAMGLARGGGTLHLVTVVESPTSPYEASFEVESWMNGWVREKRAERERYMADVAHRVEEATARKPLVEFLDGEPGDALPAYAAQNDMDLVVMSTHGRGPFARAWLGSVADRVIRKGTVPVLLVRPNESDPEVVLASAGPFRKILVPLDGSQVAEAALHKAALEQLWGEGAEVTLFHVIGLLEPPIGPEAVGASHFARNLVEAQRKASEEYLNRVATRLTGWGCRVSVAVSEEPSAWAGIVNFAHTNGYDLIAMATHGRGGAARMLIGSMADRVIRNATVPVLLFRPERLSRPHAEEGPHSHQMIGMR